MVEYQSNTTMNKYILITILSAISFSLGSGKASARDDEALYALGGFIGGVITTKVFDNHRSKRRHHHHNSSSKVVHVETRGHYKEIQVREWVDGYWEVYRDSCGRKIRNWHDGYYTYVNKRVWVEEKPHRYSSYSHKRR